MVDRKCLYCGEPVSISENEFRRGRGRYCSVACSNRGRNENTAIVERIKTIQETRKVTNQVAESFTLPLKPYNITITKLLNGNMMVFSDIPSDNAPPCVAAAVKTVENTVLCHHLAGVNVLEPHYLRGLSDILHMVCKTEAPTIWGYDSDD